MDSLRPIENVVVSTELTKEQRAKALNVLTECPVAALPVGGAFLASRLNTFEDLLSVTEGIIGRLRLEMQDLSIKRDELDTLKRDLKTAGRIFKLMTDDEE